MAQLMLVNPRRKKRKMSAAQRKYFGKRRKRRSVSANPRRRRRRVTRARRVSANPIRRRRRVRRNPVATVSRRRKRGGSGLSIRSLTSGGFLKSMVIPAAIGAAGAVALDAAYGFLPLPANLKTGQFAAPVKAAAVLGIGALASKFIPGQRRVIEGAVAASLTIMAYNWLKANAQTMLPGVNLGTYIDGVGYVQAGQYLPTDAMPGYGDGMGTYISSVPQSTVAWSDAQYADPVF